MRLERLGGGGHDVGKSNRALGEIEFLGSEQVEIDCRGIRRQRQVLRCALAKNAREARVRILNVEDRIFGRLFLGELEIEIELAVGLAEQKEKSHHVGADFVDQLVERDVG